MRHTNNLVFYSNSTVAIIIHTVIVMRVKLDDDDTWGGTGSPLVHLTLLLGPISLTDVSEQYY